MSEKKMDKERTCRQCGEILITTAKGINKHYDACKAAALKAAALSAAAAEVIHL